MEILPYFEQRNQFEKWDYLDNRNNVAGGMKATQAQVIKFMLCPTDPIQQPVSQLTAANAGPGTPAWNYGYYGSVHSLKAEIDIRVFARLVTRAGEVGGQTCVYCLFARQKNQKTKLDPRSSRPS